MSNQSFLKAFNSSNGFWIEASNGNIHPTKYLYGDIYACEREHYRIFSYAYDKKTYYAHHVGVRKGKGGKKL